MSNYPFKYIGVSGVNTFSNDQYMACLEKVQPLLDVLTTKHNVITTDVNGGADLQVRMWIHKNGGSFTRLPHLLSAANEPLVRLSDVVFFFWDGKHRGIRQTIELCQEQSKPYWVTSVESNRAGGYRMVDRWSVL